MKLQKNVTSNPGLPKINTNITNSYAYSKFAVIPEPCLLSRVKPTPLSRGKDDKHLGNYLPHFDYLQEGSF